MPTVADLVVKYSADTADAEAGAKRVEGGMSGMKKAAIGAAIGAGTAVAGFIGASIFAAANFEQAMDGVSASLGGVGTAGGITEEQFRQLSDEALRIGQTTSVGATDAARAMDLLGKAGVSVEEIYGGVAQGVVNVSEATGESIEQSASSFGTLQNMFRDTGISSSQMSDTIVNAMNASDMSLSELQTGVARLAPVISATGMSFQDSAGAIAYFNSLGFSAAEVGTSLTAAFTSMVAPTTDQAAAMEAMGIAAFDAQGSFVGFPAIMDQVAEATAGMTEEQTAETIATLFGADARDLMTEATKEGGGPLRDYIKLMNQSGTAAIASATRMDNLRGDIEQLRGAIETLMIRVGTAMLPGLRNITQTLTGVIEGIMDFADSIGELMDLGLNPLEALLGAIQIAFLNAGWDTAADAMGTLMGVADDLQEAFGNIVDAAQALLDLDLGLFFSELGDAASSLMDALSGVSDALLSGLQAAFDAIPWGTLWDTAVAALGAVVDAAPMLVNLAIDAAIELAGMLAGWARSGINWVLEQLGIGGPTKVGVEPITIGDVILDGIAKLGSVLQGVSDNVRGWLESQGIGGPSKVGQAPISLGDVVLDGAAKLGSFLQGIADDLAGWLESEIVADGSGIEVTIGEIVIDVLNAISDVTAADVQGWIQTAIDALGQIKATASDVAIVIHDPNIQTAGGGEPSVSWFESFWQQTVNEWGTVRANVNEWNAIFQGEPTIEGDPKGQAESTLQQDLTGLRSLVPEWFLDTAGTVWNYDLSQIGGAIENALQEAVDQSFPETGISNWGVFLKGIPKILPNFMANITGDLKDTIENWLDGYEWDIEMPDWNLDIDVPEIGDKPSASDIISKIEDALPDITVPDFPFDLDLRLPSIGNIPSVGELIALIREALPDVTVPFDFNLDLNPFGSDGGGQAGGAAGGAGGGTGVGFGGGNDYFARGGSGGDVSGITTLPKVGTGAIPIPDYSGVINAANAARQAVVAAFTNMQIEVAAAVRNTVTSAGGAFAGLTAALVNPANSARQAVVAAFTNMQIQVAQAMTNTVTSATAAFQAIVANLTNSANMASQAVHAAFVNMQINVAATMVAFVANVSTSALTAGAQFSTNLTQGLTAAAANLQIQVAAMISQLTNFQSQASARGLAAGQSFNQGLTQGMNAAVANTQIAMSRIQSAMNIGSQFGLGQGIGSSLGSGINAGIASWTSAIAATAVAAVLNAAAAARAAADSSSPSKLFMGIGADLGEGMVLGIEQKHRDVAQAFAGLMPDRNIPSMRHTNANSGLAYAGRSGSGGVVNQHFYVLTPEKLVETMKNAKKGAIAHDQMSPRGRELSLGLRGI